MSIKHGVSALNLEMTDRVPRTEYSVEGHWQAVEAFTGIKITSNSTEQEKFVAQQAFFKAWNYDLMWGVLINNSFLGSYYTDMGHANYEEGGVDFRETGTAVFEDEEDVFAFDPMEKLPHYTEAELINRFNDDYDKRCERSPDAINMTGTYITAMSGLIDILGWDMLLLSAGVDYERFGRLMCRYIEWMKPFYTALAKSKTPYVMAHDDIVWTSGAFIDPQWYKKYIFPGYKELFAPVIESGKKLLYTSDGTYDEFIDDIVNCGVNGFVMEPTTDMGYIAEKYGKTHSFIGNADTRVLLMGGKDDIYAEVKRCMDIGKKCPGFFMAVGNHIPANTPLDSIKWYEEFYRELSKR